jgi:hypothetical protein
LRGILAVVFPFSFSPLSSTLCNSVVQCINNVFHIVSKVESVLENTYIFDLIDNVEYVVYALYSRIPIFWELWYLLIAQNGS